MKVVHHLHASFLHLPTSITPEGPQKGSSGIGCAPVLEAGDTDVAVMIAAPGVGIVSVRLSERQLDTFAHMLADALDRGLKAPEPFNQVVSIN
jgi:hypothetical protein